LPELTANPSVTGPLTYNDTIGPLFDFVCGSCHGEGGIQGLNLNEYASALQGGISGPAVIPGDADSSLVVQRQTGNQPHFAQFTPEEITLVIEWIEAGAPEN
jgi:mono/diheme cytochrome c family protein